MYALLVVLATTACMGQTALSQSPAPGSTPATAQQSIQDANALKARDLLQKTIKALGGDAYLQIQDMQFSGRTYGFHHGEPVGTGTLFWEFWKWPEKDRIELTKQRDVVYITNGDKGYEVTFRGTGPQDKEQLQDYLRRRHYSLPQVLRVWLSQPGTALFYEGTAAANRKPAEQITIMNAQNEGVTLYIDQETFLPLRKTFTWRDPQTRDRTEEGEIYDNYRNVQGVMTPFSITRQKDGEPANQRFINEVKYNQNLSDSLFSATIPLSQGKKKP